MCNQGGEAKDEAIAYTTRMKMNKKASPGNLLDKCLAQVSRHAIPSCVVYYYKRGSLWHSTRKALRRIQPKINSAFGWIVSMEEEQKAVLIVSVKVREAFRCQQSNGQLGSQNKLETLETWTRLTRCQRHRLKIPQKMFKKTFEYDSRIDLMFTRVQDSPRNVPIISFIVHPFIDSRWVVRDFWSTAVGIGPWFANPCGVHLKARFNTLSTLFLRH